MNDIQVVVFDLNNELCSVETSIVYKIEKYGSISLVPQMPDYIKGIYNLRGKVVPVVDLNKRFNLGESEVTKKTKIIITEKDDQLYGFMVNNVTEIINLNENSVDRSEAVIRLNSKKYIKGIGKNDGKLFSIIDLNEILHNEEIKEVTTVLTENVN
ncbi:CheW protein [Ruminiclostridium papyrosolvens DSM 2782]|uniref:CheW protein n=1 Tax=Ruminiclostridium papyrosolvens DSM 2782 TaxID=588581 RepID=F1TEK8_9FIRM|nr:chemotaxis protein CheW [Ruminiclostridium papyrosolvens]EGD47174.1 CheW protein [Ruminiclostridium papyrosolvens DSM 2782]WES36214.1 chemotaxis protein CheW [Ruminiclostridium papyrosolvens DSM 2782]